MTYEARPAGCRPGTPHYSGGATFSVGVGSVVPRGARKPAVIYRVRGKVSDEEQIDLLAARLVVWLNRDKAPEMDPFCPRYIPFWNDRSARIVVTQAGIDAGWLKP